MTPEEFTRTRRTISERLAAALVALWQSLGSWHRPDADEFTDAAVPLVRGAQRTLADLTAAFIADLVEQILGRPVTPPGVPDDAAMDLRRGTTPFEVYQRPFQTVWYELSQDRDLGEAVDLGETRLVQVIERDLQETYAHASRAAMDGLDEGDRPTWWARVLQGAESCALCHVASTRPYSIEDLNPLHPACDCTVEPRYGERPGVVDEDRLDEVYAAVRREFGRLITSAAELRKLRVVFDNDEVGRVLAWKASPRPREG